MSTSSIESVLSDLQSGAPDGEASRRDARLEAAALHPDYLLLLSAEGDMVGVPDSEGRRLAAVFTSEAAREAFRDHLQLTPDQVEYVTAQGRDLFCQLCDMHLDAAIFNCAGPGEAIRLLPQTLLDIANRAQPDGADATQGDFDRLARAAFPNGQPGPIQAMDALWTELLDLKEWILANRPDASGNPYPFIAIVNDRRSVFAFTDSERCRDFCAGNHLLDPSGKNRFHLSMPLPGVLRWIAEAGATGGEFEDVQFNFGGVGWFCPVENFPAICRHLNRFVS